MAAVQCGGSKPLRSAICHRRRPREDTSGNMDEMLQDFLTEASELLSGVDNKLVDLERRPGDAGLLNDIFRGFHTIKGGAGFLNLPAMVDLCHLTENIFDKLRRNELVLNASIMDAILEATGVVRVMFDDLQRGGQPQPASSALLARLRAVISGETPATPVLAAATIAAAPVASATRHSPQVRAAAAGEPDWDASSIRSRSSRRPHRRAMPPSRTDAARATTLPANRPSRDAARPTGLRWHRARRRYASTLRDSTTS